MSLIWRVASEVAPASLPAVLSPSAGMMPAGQPPGRRRYSRRAELGHYRSLGSPGHGSLAAILSRMIIGRTPCLAGCGSSGDRGPFGFAQGRLFDSAEPFASRMARLRSEFVTLFSFRNFVARNLFVFSGDIFAKSKKSQPLRMTFLWGRLLWTAGRLPSFARLGGRGRPPYTLFFWVFGVVDYVYYSASDVED